MMRLVGTLFALSMAAAGAAFAQEAPPQNKGGEAVVGKQQGMKMAQAQCQTLWSKANPANKPKISAGQAQPFIADVMAANSNKDGAIDQKEFMAACDNGLMKDPATANTGSSSGTEGAAGPAKPASE